MAAVSQTLKPVVPTNEDGVLHFAGSLQRKRGTKLPPSGPFGGTKYLLDKPAHWIPPGLGFPTAQPTSQHSTRAPLAHIAEPLLSFPLAYSLGPSGCDPLTCQGIPTILVSLPTLLGGGKPRERGGVVQRFRPVWYTYLAHLHLSETTFYAAPATFAQYLSEVTVCPSVQVLPLCMRNTVLPGPHTTLRIHLISSSVRLSSYNVRHLWA